ncbi:MAG TPA: hypothetical protein VMZ33_01100 [Candidatus Limnocylindrales bacterium]|nr:hypothetical protein [Candidatus Limnocylindrales bacterium]
MATTDTTADQKIADADLIRAGRRRLMIDTLVIAVSAGYGAAMQRAIGVPRRNLQA